MAARFEYKYRLTLREYLVVRQACSGFVALDHFSKANTDKRYFVRSLYYDTYDYRYYFEKLSGECNRVKPRIRSYFKTEVSTPFVSVELKTRQGLHTLKYSEHVDYDCYRQFMASGSWNHDSDVCIEFSRFVHLNGLQPKLLVDYLREAFVANDASGIRLTFDREVRYAAADKLFPAYANFRARDPHHVVMEIKCGMNTPTWLQEITKRYDLRSSPNSKYSNGIEQTQAGLFI